jgi:hypothetical protein
MLVFWLVFWDIVVSHHRREDEDRPVGLFRRVRRRGFVLPTPVLDGPQGRPEVMFIS